MATAFPPQLSSALPHHPILCKSEKPQRPILKIRGIKIILSLPILNLTKLGVHQQALVITALVATLV